MDDEKLYGPITGLLSGFNILSEALIVAKAIDRETLAALLKIKIEQFQQSADSKMFEAANILDQLRRPLVSEDRAATRKLLDEPPKGVA
jgi:hypothetical protein